ncbi:MAG: peptide deformylase [Elusimicrobiota bacterium]|jgi:peptide deformylase
MSLEKALRKTLAILLAAGLLLAQTPSQKIAYALGQAASVPAAAPIAQIPLQTPALAASSQHAWQLYPSRLFFTDFPGLEGFKSLPQPALMALARSLDRSGLEPAGISALAPEKQIRTVRTAIKSLYSSLQKEELEQKAESSPSERLKSMALRRTALRDLSLSAVVLDVQEREGFLKDLSVSENRVERQFREESSQLIQGKIAQILPKGGASWRGRTADIELEDGSVLSFKRHPDLAALLNESGKMEEVLSFGIDAPIPLSRANGQFGLKYPGEQKKSLLATEDGYKKNESERYLPYLMPKSLVDGYRGYLNDKLPKGLSMKQKAAKLEDAALKAVEHMLLLLKNNRVHASLMPLSHHGAHWEWDFWRWNPPFLGKLRYGPSFINHWKQAFDYPNLRRSGLADWEHIEPLKYFYQTHEHNDHAHGTVHHDAYSLALGQNLAELSFILLHSGAVNGISNDDTARIIVKAVQAYLAGLLPEGTAANFSEQEALSAARASSRSFAWARRFWKPATLLAGAILLAGLGWSAAQMQITAVSFMMLYGAAAFLIMLCLLDGVQMIPGNMPGSVVHPLLMSVIKPAVELLRDNAQTIGLPALAHPSGSPWDFRQALVFTFGLPAALIIPTASAALFGFFGLQAAAALGFMAPPMTLAYIAGSAFTLAALRVIRFLFALTQHAPPRSAELSAQAPTTGPPSRRRAILPVRFFFGIFSVLRSIGYSFHLPKPTPADLAAPKPENSYLLDIEKSGSSSILLEETAQVSSQELSSPEFQRLLLSMERTMTKAGGIGIAAPQVGVGKRVLLLEARNRVLALINPRMTVLDARTRSYPEGCLSVPDELSFVERYRKIRIDYLDREGNPHSEIFSGFSAVAAQHELDHLDGVLFPMRTLGYSAKFNLGEVPYLRRETRLELSRLLAGLDASGREMLKQRSEKMRQDFEDVKQPGSPAFELRRAPGISGDDAVFLEALAYHRIRLSEASIVEQAELLGNWIKSPNHALFAYEDLSKNASPEASALLALLGERVPAMAPFRP